MAWQLVSTLNAALLQIPGGEDRFRALGVYQRQWREYIRATKRLPPGPSLPLSPGTSQGPLSTADASNIDFTSVSWNWTIQHWLVASATTLAGALVVALNYTDNMKATVKDLEENGIWGLAPLPIRPALIALIVMVAIIYRSRTRRQLRTSAYTAALESSLVRSAAIRDLLRDQGTSLLLDRPILGRKLAAVADTAISPRLSSWRRVTLRAAQNLPGVVEQAQAEPNAAGLRRRTQLAILLTRQPSGELAR